MTISQHILKAFKFEKNQRLKIFELGGGLGHLARTLKLYHPLSCHVIVDLPETLFFSIQFLNLNFQNCRYKLVSNDTQLNENDFEENDFIFIPTKYSNVLMNVEFDLFVNTASMGEMKNSVIRYWMNFIQNEIKVKNLYTLNRFLNVIIAGRDNWRTQENECSLLYDQRWDILCWELEPKFTCSPYVDTVVARYVEIIATRLTTVDIAQSRIESERLLEEVKCEDWHRQLSICSPVMIRLGNILSNDLGKSGALYKLWNSIRFNTTAENVWVMLQYLDTIVQKGEWEFEETYFYEHLFLSLVSILHNDEKYNQYCERIKIRSLYREKYRVAFPSLNRPYNIGDFNNHGGAYQIKQFYGYDIISHAGYIIGLNTEIITDGFIYTEEAFNKCISNGSCFLGYSVFEIESRILEKLFNSVKSNSKFTNNLISFTNLSKKILKKYIAIAK